MKRTQKKSIKYFFSLSCFVSNAIILFLLKLKCVFELAGKHTEALLNKPREQDLVQLVPNTENNMGSKISEKTNKLKISRYARKSWK